MSNRSHRPRVLIIADSLALPRDHVGFEDTWPAILMARIPQVTWINRAQRLSTTERLNGEGNGGFDCLEYFDPDLVILQLGICDCSPRVLSRKTAWLVYRLPLVLSTQFTSWMELLRGRKASNCFVPVTAFERNLRQYLGRAKKAGTRVMAIAIFPASRLLVSKNPGVLHQINSYNGVLNALAHEHSHFSVVQPFTSDSEIDDLFIDGYHLNVNGGLTLCEHIYPKLIDLLATGRDT